MSKKLNCPACAGEIDFRSGQSVFAVCPYCRSMVVRHDVNLELLGKMADLQKDMSPLQIYSTGKFGSENFSVVGRQRLKWSHGLWNEWYCSFDSGREGWLAEAQGQFMMSFAVETPKNLPALKILAPDAMVEIRGKFFSVSDIKEAEVLGSEGELPFASPKGRRQTSVDLSSDEGTEFACLEYAGDGIKVFIGRYVELEEMKMQTLRTLEGW